MKPYNIFFIMLLLFLPGSLQAGQATTFIDSSGTEISLAAQPRRVVSLVPSVTEMLLRIGADESVVGLTYHSLLPPEAAGKEIIGGFFSPDMDRVAALNPDIIFYAGLQKEVLPRFQGQVVLVNLSAKSIAEAFDHIELLGRIFNRQDEAAAIIAEEKRQLEVIEAKVAKIPVEKRKRVMRLMGRDKVMAPGDDSFQNDYIRAAGGIAPQFGINGNIIPVDLDQWRNFNPQVLYGCGDDRQTMTILNQPGWREVDAVKNNNIIFFPCALTCRAATHPGYFVSWLSARIYGSEFSEPGNFVLPEQVVSRRPLALDLDYIEAAEFIDSDIKDFRNKTVALHFTKPMTVVSTLEGQRTGITTVANHYFPPPSWGLGHKQGLGALRQNTQQVLGLAPESTAMLFTGANMDNLAVVRKSFKDMEVTALVTAGVQSNAVRMGADIGNFYEPEKSVKPKKPGTINILLMTNMKLSPRAMTRAIISATEGKTAALQDMDIRSSYSSALNQATGTGTDNIIVVEGSGVSIDSSGGHTKMGELMAQAVYEGVQQASHLQNGVVTGRSVFQRLKDRKISLFNISKRYGGQVALHRTLENLLLQDQYANFIQAIMAISDDYEKGLITNLSSVNVWCQAIAGGEFAIIDLHLPTVLNLGMNGLLAKASRQHDLAKSARHNDR
jgi:adenosylcobinamide amidohydrolase/ABC-type Fe3+-hydroxamate transport system substrate-binding protein